MFWSKYNTYKMRNDQSNKPNNPRYTYCCYSKQRPSKTYSQLRIATLPSNQPIICRNSSPVKVIIKDINALKKELKTIPVKMIVSTRSEPSIFLAKVMTIIKVINAAIILINGNV